MFAAETGGPRCGACRPEPAEPPAFKPVSLLIRAELAQILAHPTGAVHGMTAGDLVSDAQQMADFPNDYTLTEVTGMLQVLAGVLDEVNGLLK